MNTHTHTDTNAQYGPSDEALATSIQRVLSLTKDSWQVTDDIPATKRKRKMRKSSLAGNASFTWMPGTLRRYA